MAPSKPKGSRLPRGVYRTATEIKALAPLFADLPAQEFREALALLPEMLVLQKLLFDVRFANKSAGELFEEAGVTPQQVAEAWRSHAFVRTHMYLSTQMPRLIADMCEDAKSQVFPCQLVYKNDDHRHCKRCHGTKEIREPGNTAARRMLLEYAGMIGKTATTQIQVNNGFMGGETSLEKMIEVTSRINAMPAPAIESPAVEVTG